MENLSFNTDLIIVGGGAAGLMAGVAAGEQALRCIVLERRHRPGLKLLMCGNNRCNVSHAGTTQEIAEAYGEPTESFLTPALEAFSPGDLRALFNRWQLPTIVNRDRIYPASEKADDVLHCFTDKLRDLEVPFMTNFSVESVQACPGGFIVKSRTMTLTSRFILLATGGYSYPKTGSVGDGQRFAQELGLEVTEPRPGLAGVDLTAAWLPAGDKLDIQQAEVHIYNKEHRCVATTRGNLLVEGDCLRGTAIFDAVRQISRRRLEGYTLGAVVDRKNIPPALSQIFTGAREVTLPVAAIRPLKEAIVTVGGVALSEIDSATMESKKLPGLFFAGELLDVDGPTGGYNLHAAFATARLAISAIASRLHPPQAPHPANSRRTEHPCRTASPGYSERPSRTVSSSRSEYAPRPANSPRPQQLPVSSKRSKRGDRWGQSEPPPWRRRPNS